MAVHVFGYTFRCTECKYVGADINDHIVTEHKDLLTEKNIYELIETVRFEDVVIRTKPLDPEFEVEPVTP